ncbi:fluoride efflux transporter CrcB [Solilutibacter silvestris]|uniref:fluoride efflux transporter CrcB n=1 Tax=Solilutibacter silvestris TaxID=1645665 RepID=UPI003D3450E2
MPLQSTIAIFIGAGFGALSRWWLGLALNSIFPTIPLGTLAANLIGGFVMGLLMATFDQFQAIPPAVRLALTTGFLGGLTTFSTFSAEASTLLLRQQFGWGGVLVLVHVAGSILCTLAGVGIAGLLIGKH